MENIDYKKLEKIKYVSSIIANRELPHAFEQRYWSMANTTYYEEIAHTVIQKEKLNVATSKTFLRKCKLFKKDFPILYYLLDGHIKDSMGAHYALTPIGEKFLNKFL